MRRRSYSRRVFFLVFFVFTTFPVWAAAPDVGEIVAKANHMAYYQGEDGKARVEMTIVDDQGRTRHKTLTILRKNMDDQDREQRFYVYFHRPSDERGTVFMVWKHVGEDDDRWLYLPALDVSKRIAASDERTSFVGSHFFYEDVSGRGIQEDAHELIETSDNYYVLKNTPQEPENVEFDHYIMYIHKTTFLPVKAEYYRNEHKYREMSVLEVQNIQGKTTITRQQMHDLESGGHTVLEFKDVVYDNNLPEDIFTERYLRRAPRQYLR